MEGMWKEVVVAEFQLVFQHLPGGIQPAIES
jgi:hypothetical protein